MGMLWLILVTLMKGSMMMLTNFCDEIIRGLFFSIDRLFSCYPEVKLAVAVVITPAILNTMQFLIVDSFIENKHDSSPYVSPSAVSPYMVSSHIVEEVITSNDEPSITQPLLPSPQPLSPSSPSLLPAVKPYLDLRDFERYATDVRGMDKNDFIRFSAKDSDFAAYHGFDQLDHVQKSDYFGFIAGDNSRVNLETVQNALLDQSNLVRIFNQFLDVGQGGSFTLGGFSGACRYNIALAALFKLSRNNEGNIEISEIRACFNNMADVYGFFAGMERKVGFSQVHKFLHSPHYGYSNPQELRE